MKKFMPVGITSLMLSQLLVTVTMGSSHKRLGELVNSERNLLDSLEAEIKQQESHVLFLERRLEELSASAPPRQIDKEQYLSNALNNLVLIRRLIIDWSTIARIVPDLLTIPSEVPWPKEEDMRDIARPLARLQRTYGLRTEDLARGWVQGSPADVNITGVDCLNVALYYHQEYHHLLASQWLDHALAKLDNSVTSTAVLDLAVLSRCYLGDTAGSVSALTELLTNFPDHTPATHLDKWQKITSSDCPQQKVTREKWRKQIEFSDVSEEGMDTFHSLCRAVTGSSLQAQHVLSCRYVHYNKTTLRLRPFRAEELQLDPPVLLFHDLISDAEIEEIYRLSIPELHKSEVLTEDGFSYPSKRRTSETTVIESGESIVMDRVTRRMAEVTNLDISTAEESHITRYGLGGENLPHVDFFDNHTVLAGDRIATLMIYLSEVPLGGHTVFQNWGLSVPPQKGAALFWPNLHRNGSGDFSTEHAGCPVIQGTKWVLNKWFHEVNNDLTTYCVEDKQASYKHFYV
ncbi:Prolyl 4-hydroxylase, alpha polypeptide [Homalodisca vitripennis]|nr:Prolyl 4-hydroxylase, alpha polypeptide [Homalodisca vitripennis]KAG8289573.1 Prolyl 4-hydroxylase, alpha polypeptide [Homalodisca vitripennis]